MAIKHFYKNIIFVDLQLNIRFSPLITHSRGRMHSAAAVRNIGQRTGKTPAQRPESWGRRAPPGPRRLFGHMIEDIGFQQLRPLGKGAVLFHRQVNVEKARVVLEAQNAQIGAVELLFNVIGA